MSKRYFSETKVPGAVTVLAIPALLKYQRIYTHMEIGNDKVTANLFFYSSSVKLPSNAIALNGQAIILMDSTTGLFGHAANGDWVIVQDNVDPTHYEWREVIAVNAGVSITLHANITADFPAGSSVYGCRLNVGATPDLWLPMGGATTITRTNAEGVYVTDEDVATLMVMSSITASCRWTVTGFVRNS